MFLILAVLIAAIVFLMHGGALTLAWVACLCSTIGITSLREISAHLDKNPKQPTQRPRTQLEKLPNSPQITAARDTFMQSEEPTAVGTFVLEMDRLVNERIKEIKDWSKVDPWTDRLEPMPPARRVSARRANQIDQLPEKLSSYNRSRPSHKEDCVCSMCLDVRIRKQTRQIANVYATPPHYLQSIDSPYPVSIAAPTSVNREARYGGSIIPKHQESTRCLGCGVGYGYGSQHHIGCPTLQWLTRCVMCDYVFAWQKPMHQDCPSCNTYHISPRDDHPSSRYPVKSPHALIGPAKMT